MPPNMRAVFAAVIGLVVACTSPAEKKASAVKVARTAIAAESAKAAEAAARPATGRWDEAHLVESLVRAGLAPRALTQQKGEAYWNAPLLAYQLGSASLHAYIYADSVARRRVTDGLDSLSAAPRGVASPYPIPRLLIVQNNLAAVLIGGSDRQQDRVSLAIGAGLPVSTPR
ncbi:MAG: hypothetical protein ACHQQ3_13765 [Gemmatimonadales bacterium]